MYVILGKGVRTTPICELLVYQKSNVEIFSAYLWSWKIDRGFLRPLLLFPSFFLSFFFYFSFFFFFFFFFGRICLSTGSVVTRNTFVFPATGRAAERFCQQPSPKQGWPSLIRRAY